MEFGTEFPNQFPGMLVLVFIRRVTWIVLIYHGVVMDYAMNSLTIF